MRFLAIVLVAVTMVRIATSCENRKTIQVKESTDSTRITDGNVGNDRDLTDVGTFPDYIPTGLHWDEIQSDLKEEQLSEVRSPDIYVRHSPQTTLYSIPKTLLFASEEMDINPELNDELEQIAASIRQRYPQGRVYVHSHAGKSNPPGLYQEQAVQLKQWLVVHGHMDEARVFIYDGKNEPAHAPESLMDRRVAGEVMEIIAIHP